MTPRTILAALALALAGGVTWWYVADPGTGEVLDELPVDAQGRPLDERAARAQHDARLRAQARNTHFEDRDEVRGSAPLDPYGTGVIDRVTAENGFDDVMTRVEGLARSRERIDREAWDQLYREANDAFAALSSLLDAREPSDLEALEKAHHRLQEGLRRVRVRGRKFSDI